jgi:hypothetical protein
MECRDVATINHRWAWIDGGLPAMTAFQTMTARTFVQNASGAKNLAKDGPVLITERGEPAFVLLNIRDFRELTGQRTTGSIVDRLACPASADIEFDAPKSDEHLAPLDLS